jgi:hypothetical protein
MAIKQRVPLLSIFFILFIFLGGFLLIFLMATSNRHFLLSQGKNSAIEYIAPQLSDEMSHFYVDYLAIYRQGRLDLKTIVLENRRAKLVAILKTFRFFFIVFLSKELISKVA